MGVNLDRCRRPQCPEEQGRQSPHEKAPRHRECRQRRDRRAPARCARRTPPVKKCSAIGTYPLINTSADKAVHLHICVQGMTVLRHRTQPPFSGASQLLKEAVYRATQIRGLLVDRIGGAHDLVGCPPGVFGRGSDALDIAIDPAGTIGAVSTLWAMVRAAPLAAQRRRRSRSRCRRSAGWSVRHPSWWRQRVR